MDLSGLRGRKGKKKQTRILLAVGGEEAGGSHRLILSTIQQSVVLFLANSSTGVQ